MLKEDIKIIDSSKLYKLCKYYCRIKKSFNPLNKNKLNEYLLHLKHHIYFGGSNISDTDFEILNGLVNELINVLGDFNTKSNSDISLTGKLIEKLELKLKDFDELNKLNQLNNNSNQEEIEKKNDEIKKKDNMIEELNKLNQLNNNSNQEEIEKKNDEIKKKDDIIEELNLKIKTYFNILTKIKEIVEKIKQDKNTQSVLENEKNKIISDIEKLNKDLDNKSERIQSLQNKLADNEKNISDTDKTDNEKILELNKKSETLKNMIDRFETDSKNISSSIETKQKQIEVLDEKIKLATDTNISDYKTQISNIDYSDELSLIIGSIFNSLFETLYGKDIADKIIKNSI